jgi:hypothetical protein
MTGAPSIGGPPSASEPPPPSVAAAHASGGAEPRDNAAVALLPARIEHGRQRFQFAGSGHALALQ